MQQPEILQKLAEALTPGAGDETYDRRHSRHQHHRDGYQRVLIHNARFLFTCDAADHIQILENHSIAIEGGTIAAVEPAADFSPTDFDLVYDAGKRGGTIITPGFINTHAHPPMYLMRSAMMLDEGERIDETIASMPRWERAMEEEHYAIAAIGDITEQQKYGITTTLSHYGVFWPIEYAALLTKHHIINALSAVSNTHPENSPALIRQLVAEKNARYTTRPAIALHYLYKASGEALDEIKKIIDEHGLLFTCHMAESEEVARKCVETHGLREVALLEKHGLLNERAIVSHAIYVTDDEIAKLARNRVGIAHLPTSNVIHKSGTFPFWKFEDAGGFPYLSLGTDSVVSKSRLDLLTEAYQTRITHLYERTVKFGSLFKMMTTNAGRVLHESARGRLAPGAKADIAFWKLKDRGTIPYDEASPITLIGNLVTHGGRTVRDLMIDGRFVIRDRRHVFIDESQLLSAIQEAHMAMRKRVESKKQ